MSWLYWFLQPDTLIQLGLTLPFLAGTLLALGWWIFIDAILLHSINAYTPIITTEFYIPGIVSMVGLLLSLATPVTGLKRGFVFNVRAACCNRMCHFIAFCVCFAGMMMAIVLVIDIDQLWLGVTDKEEHGFNDWVGIAIILQTLCLLLSTLTCLVHRTAT